jgi:hypothetical protein
MIFHLKNNDLTIMLTSLGIMDMRQKTYVTS